MRLEQIVRILDGLPGARKDGAAYVIPDSVELSVFVALPSELLTVARIARIDLSAELLSLDTMKGERIHFAPEHVAAIKSTPAARAVGNRGAGFTKSS